MRCVLMLLLSICLTPYSMAGETTFDADTCAKLNGSWKGKRCEFSTDSQAAREACIGNGNSWEFTRLSRIYYCHPDSKERCETRGGWYEHLCMLGIPFCVIPTKDAGKPCTDSSQCEQGCKYVGGNDTTLDKWPWRQVPSEGSDVQGECARNNFPASCPGGNRASVEGGMLKYGPVE